MKRPAANELWGPAKNSKAERTPRVARPIGKASPTLTVRQNGHYNQEGCLNERETPMSTMHTCRARPDTPSRGLLAALATLAIFSTLSPAQDVEAGRAFKVPLPITTESVSRLSRAAG